MDSVPVILDISSDEEADLGKPRGSGGDSLDWLSELLGGADDKERDDDSDEVVVVREVINAKRKSKPLKMSLIDADDDCVILEGGPDDPVAVVVDDTGGSDELLIVGEKGQIACRDYPHPRHLCAKFPFSSTPHDSHCEQCHCYVCESLAPCLHWVASISNIDHCHASDKEEIWKIQRTTFKLGENAPLPPFKSPGSSLPTVISQIKQAQPRNIIRLAPDPMSQNQVSIPNVLRACSALTTHSVPNIISQGRSQQSTSVLAKNRFRSPLVSQHLLGVCSSNATQRDQNMNIGNCGPGLVRAHTMFKRAGPVRGALPMRPSVSGSSDDINCAHAVQHTRNGTPTASTNDRNLFGWPNVSPSVNLESYGPQDSSLLDLGRCITNVVPSQPHLNTQPIAQFNDSEIFCPNGREYYCSHGYHVQNAYNQNGNQILNDSQNICQQGSQSQGATDAGFSDFSLPINSCLSNPHLPIENSIQSTYDPNLVEESNSQSRPEIIASTKSLCEPSPVKEANCEPAGNFNLRLVDFELENWILENHPVPVVSDGSVSEMNLFSHENSLIDTGMLLFDFETSWNGLAHT